MTTDEQVAEFADVLDAEIAESMKDSEYATAWRRIEIREATAGLDKRQARRARRRISLSLVRPSGANDGE